MNVKRKPEIDEKKMGKNPFILNQIIKARTFEKGNNLLLQTDEGVNIPVGNVKDVQVLEEQTYTKLYHDVDFRKIVLKFSGNALKLHYYIMYKIESNCDYIWINNTQFQNEVGCSKKEYVEACHELIRYGMITPTIYQETYFVNPLVFFCGNRLKKYPDNLSVRM